MPPDDLFVEPLALGDVVAFAHCVALDVTVFPHPSIPPLGRRGATPPILIARGGPGGDPFGFVAARRRGKVLEIVGLAVVPRRRRCGVGRALVQAAVAAARAERCSAVVLQVATTNDAALALYASLGFARAQVLHGYYRRVRPGDTGDAWAMVLHLR